MGNITAKYAFYPPQNRYDPSTYPINKINNRHVPYFIIEANPPTSAWILYSHANSEDMSTIVKLHQTFQRIHRCNIIVYDYQGYGSNEGTPSEDGCKKDALAMFLMLVKEMNIKQKNIALMGHSIGSGPTLWLANQIQNKKLTSYGIEDTSLGSVFVFCGFTSCCSVVSKKLTWIPFLDIFKNTQMIKELKMPVFIGHGDDDEVINVQHAYELYDVIVEKDNKVLYIVEGAHHNDIFMFTEFQCAFLSFLDNYFVNQLVENE